MCVRGEPLLPADIFEFAGLPNEMDRRDELHPVLRECASRV
ncbi:MAG: hypothetical protein ACI93T_001061, partial [Porticoccaceae bacterium]